MSLATPADPASYSEQLPKHSTITVDRDSGTGLDAAVARMLTYTDMPADEARRVVMARVRDARAGDVFMVGSARICVR